MSPNQISHVTLTLDENDFNIDKSFKTFKDPYNPNYLKDFQKNDPQAKMDLKAIRNETIYERN